MCLNGTVAAAVENRVVPGSRGWGIDMKLKTIAAALAVSHLALPLAAEAADLGPVRAAPVAAPFAAPVFTWSGFYFGAHLGGAWADRDSRVDFLAVNCSACSLGETRSASFAGPDSSEGLFAGGLQAGYNWQSGNIVFGVEADGTLLSDSETENYSIGSAALISAGLAAITDPPDGFVGQFKSEVDWMATARARIGFTTGPVLLYATGGLAAADVGITGSYLSLVASPARIVPVAVDDSDVRFGWTIGAGVEAAITSNLSAKVEYLYADFGDTTRQLGLYINDPAAVQQFVSTRDSLAFHTFRVGLNWRFSGL
jgi:outer membrane immunogenic protein